MHNYRQTRQIATQTIFPEPQAEPAPSGGLRRGLIEALSKSFSDQMIHFAPIDDWAYLLVIPSVFKYTLDETKQIAKEIQQTILPPKNQKQPYHTLTWHDIANTNYQNPTSYKQWYRHNQQLFDEGCQIAFFYDMQAVHDALKSEVLAKGFALLDAPGINPMLVSDGHFSEHILMQHVAEICFWSARDLSDVAHEVAHALSTTFRAFHSLKAALSERFLGATFDLANYQLLAHYKDIKGELDYRSIWRGIQFANKDIPTWLSGVSLTDLLIFDEATVASIRSMGFMKARPKALLKRHDRYVVALDKEVAGRLIPIKKNEIPESQRFELFLTESRRRLYHRSFEAHTFLHEDANYPALAMVGDQIASIALAPELIKHAISDSFSDRLSTVRVLAPSDDILVIAHPKTPWANIETLLRRAGALLRELNHDGADQLHLDQVLSLPEHGCGNFKLSHVPPPYFDLIETAQDPSLALPPGRGNYLRGLAFELIRQWPLAQGEFTKAYGADSTDGDICHALGRSLCELGRNGDALVFLKKACQLLPEDPEIANTYGLALLRTNQFDKATHFFERAVQCAPDDAQFLSNLGQSYFALQRIPDAEKALHNALKYAPNFSEAHSTLAQIRWRLGDIQGARKHARKAFAANPSNKGVQDLLWALTIDEHK